MITLKLKHLPSKNISEQLIEFIKINFVIKPLQEFSDKKFYYKKLELLRSLPSNTVGNDIAQMLDKHNLEIIPQFENHDLKHLILGYGMTTKEEIEMQAYLFGNGNRTIPCILFLLSGILLPSSWSAFLTAFEKGKNAPSILQLSLDDCMRIKTKDVQQKYKAK